MAETVTSLVTMPDKLFYNLVNDDTRNRAKPELSRALRSPEVVDRWYQTLMRMSVSVEGQLGAMTAEHNAKVQNLYAERRGSDAMGVQAKFETWKAGILRFKNGLDEKLLEARSLLRLQGDSQVIEHVTRERNEALARVRDLETAIRTHKASFDGGDEASDDDELLWKTVDG